MAQRLYLDNQDGIGPRDFSKFISDIDQFTSHMKNEPVLFDFMLTPVEGLPNWVVPSRGAYIRFEDDRWSSRDLGVADGILFTGYITDDPDPVYLGSKNRNEIWAYRIKSTSEEYLINAKQVPTRTFINKTRGFILKALLDEMFVDSPTFPFNLDHVQDGGIERIYQTDPSKAWSEIAADFGKSDRYIYHVIDHHVYYQPEGQFMSQTNDPSLKVVMDNQDPRYRPDNLDLRRVSTTIANDVTVFGEDEPTTLVQEHFLSDGYKGDYPLAFEPWGTDEHILIDDALASEIDTAVWQEVDDEAEDYIQPFEGSLNIVGGPGIPATPETPATVYLRSRKGIEVTGLIEMRDAEIAFPPTPTGQGMLGALITSDVPSETMTWVGWKLLLDATEVNPNGPAIVPYGPTGLESSYSYYLNTGHSYVLRKVVDVDRRPSATPRKGPIETTIEYSLTSVAVGATITWILEEINTENPYDVKKPWIILLRKYYAGTPPEFVLYAPIVPYTCHLVMNNVMLMRPQQITVLVDGVPVKVGSYIDGGRCTVVDESAGRSKLAWYAIPGTESATPTDTYMAAVLEDEPSGYWRLGETSGDVVNDSSGNNHTAMVYPEGSSVGRGVTGLIRGDTNTCYSFDGGTAWVYLEPSLDPNQVGSISLPAAFTIEAFIKTSAGGAGVCNPIFSTQNLAPPPWYSIRFETYEGNLRCIHDNGTTLTGPAVCDGYAHHVVWTYEAGTSILYVDGQLAATGDTFNHTPVTAHADIGHLYGSQASPDWGTAEWTGDGWRGYYTADGYYFAGYGDEGIAAPTNLSVTEGMSGGDMGTDAHNTREYYCVVTAVNASGVESDSEPFLPDASHAVELSAQSHTVQCSWTAAAGAVAYRCYLGWSWYGILFTQYIETANTSCEFTVQSSWGVTPMQITPGAYSPSTPDKYVYNCAVDMGNGETPLISADITGGVPAGCYHTWYNRCYRVQVQPVPGAVEYIWVRRNWMSAPGSWNRMWTTTDPYFDDHRDGSGTVISGWSSQQGSGDNQVMNGLIDEVAVYPKVLDLERIQMHYVRSVQSVTEGVTIPAQGSKVVVYYYRKDKSRARIRSLTSIKREREKFRDDGVRQHVLQSDDVRPVPRTSEECLLVARAYLADNTETRYEGSYNFDSLESNVTTLVYWPRPGDLVPCRLTLPDGSKISQNMSIASVTTRFLGKGAYNISFDFVPTNYMEEAQRELMLRRKTSLDELAISDVTVTIDETIDDIVRPDDPVECTVVTISQDSVVLQMTDDDLLPNGVVGYEVRAHDSGWGQPNYLARFQTATFTLDRFRRDRVYFVKPYGNGYVYSERAACVRVVYPLANNIVVPDIAGTLTTDTITIEIPIPRDPDFAWLVVRQYNSVTEQVGGIIYEGDGVAQREVMNGVSVLPESGQITLVINNTAQVVYPPGYWVWIAVANLAGVLGPALIESIPVTAHFRALAVLRCRVSGVLSDTA